VTKRIGGALLLFVLSTFLWMTPATAQTNSGPNDYPPSNGATVRDFGAQRPGADFTKEDCGFAPGSTAQVSLNGSHLFDKAAESDGCVRLAVHIQNKNQVRIDGKNYAANRCADNTITVSGTHRNGGTLSYDNRFRIDCGAAVGAAALPRTGSTVDVQRWSWLGAGLVVIGIVLSIVVRRRRHPADDTVASA
jgi:hypothetical protein